MKRSAIKIIVAATFLVIGTALFKARSWSQVKYSPTDGLAMAKEVQSRVYQDQNPGRTLDDQMSFDCFSLLAFPMSIPDDSFTKTKRDSKDDCVALYTYHFHRPVTPNWLKLILAKVGKKSLSASVDWSRISESKDGESISHNAAGGIASLASPESIRENHILCQEILENLEPNSRLNLNEDFVALFVNGQVRVYSASKISLRTKELVGKVAGVPANEIWKDVDTNHWTDNDR